VPGQISRLAEAARMSLIGDGIDLLKLVDKGRNADLYKQLGEWIDKVAELQKQNAALEAERAQLAEKLKFKGRLQRIAGHTFVDGDDEEICSRCAEVDQRAVHLTVIIVDSRGKIAACPQCKTPSKSWIIATRQKAEEQAKAKKAD
jgi:hypothetical protein